MATNAQGYPYPVGTDRVMEGDDAIKSLADAVGTKVGTRFAAGTATGNFSAAATVNMAVTFPVGAFTVLPKILVSVSVASATYYAVAGPPTTSGMTITAVSKTGATLTQAVSVDWLAYQA